MSLKGSLICIVLVLAIVTVYWPVQHHDFISLDDDLYVTDNTHVQQGMSLKGLKWALTTDHAGFWIPMTWISIMIDCHLYGLNAGHHHVTNVIIHIFNTLLFRHTSFRVLPSAERRNLMLP